MYYYTAYNLHIQSEICLPELEHGPPGSDVVIRRGLVRQIDSMSSSAPHWSWADEEKVVLYWAQIGTFLIRNGNEIVIDADLSANPERVRLFLLGAAIGTLLQQRGLVVLHASAAALNDGAVVFLGGKGWGKSTMAALLHTMGYDLVADDVIALDLAQDQPAVLPSFPQIKLWPDVLALIGQTAESLPRLHPEFDKRDYRPREGFSANPIFLRRLYILGLHSKPAIEPINGTQALLGLLPHWYCARFGPQVLRNLGFDTQFLQCTNLVKQAPIYQLKRPRSLDALFKVGQLVREHDSLSA